MARTQRLALDRTIIVTLLVAGAALGGVAPRWLVVAPAALAAVAGLTHRRFEAVRTHLLPGDCAALLGWAALTSARQLIDGQWAEMQVLTLWIVVPLVLLSAIVSRVALALWLGRRQIEL